MKGKSLNEKLNDMLASDDPKERVKKYVLITAIAIAILFLLLIFSSGGSSEIDLIYTEDGNPIITLIGPQEMTIEIPTNSIVAVDYVSDIDLGTQAEGIETDDSCCGVFENDEWGRYTLYALKSVEYYVVLQIEEGNVVFNVNSKSETEALYNAFLEMGLTPVSE